MEGIIVVVMFMKAAAVAVVEEYLSKLIHLNMTIVYSIYWAVQVVMEEVVVMMEVMVRMESQKSK